MDVKKRILELKDDMINDLKELVSYNSVNEGVHGEFPFGLENGKVLASALKMFEREGLHAVNLDNYCGYGEIGEGDKVIGVLAHLDIVPCGEGWNTNPLELTEIDGKLYGRGTTDDKGAVVASLYALKILQEKKVPLTSRIRLIVGCNEETGSACLKHYVEKEGHIDMGFTPDGNFPGIYGEKGAIKATFVSRNTNIIDINGGVASNVVCNKVSIKVKENSFDLSKLDEYFKNNNIKYDIENSDGVIQMVVYGVAAHASTPTLGINAIGHLMQALEYAGFEDDFVKYYNLYIGLSTDGSKANIACNDEYGDLTFNNGVIETNDGVITGSIDIRFPVTLKGDVILKQMEDTMNNDLGYLKDTGYIKPLFFDPKSPMVEALVNSYRSVTGDNESMPEVIGGGTYSKGINNCIAFGCEFPGDDCHIHDANEFIEVDKLLLQTEIYVQALENLLQI